MGLPVGMSKTSDWDGAELTLWRKQMGFSVADVCQELGCDADDYSKWELGYQPVPRYISLACRALALGMGDIKS